MVSLLLDHNKRTNKLGRWEYYKVAYVRSNVQRYSCLKSRNEEGGQPFPATCIHYCCCPVETEGLLNNPELDVALVPFVLGGAPIPNPLGAVPVDVPPNSDWPAGDACGVETFDESPNLNVVNGDEVPLVAGVDKAGVTACPPNANVDLEASPVLGAAGVDDGAVGQENVAFVVSAGLVMAPPLPNTFEFPLEPNTVNPAPEPVLVPKGVPCVPLPNPVNADLDAVSFNWEAAVSPKKLRGEVDNELAVLNADGVFCDSFD